MKEKKLFIDLIIFGGCPTILFCFYYNIFWCDAVYFLSVHLNLYENSISIFSNQRKKHPWWLIKHKVVVWLLKDKCVVKNNKLLLPFCFFYLGTMGSVTVQMTKWEWHMSPLLLSWSAHHRTPSESLFSLSCLSVFFVRPSRLRIDFPGCRHHLSKPYFLKMCLFSYNFIYFDFKIELSGYVFQKNCISAVLPSRKSI